MREDTRNIEGNITLMALNFISFKNKYDLVGRNLIDTFITTNSNAIELPDYSYFSESSKFVNFANIEEVKQYLEDWDVNAKKLASINEKSNYSFKFYAKLLGVLLSVLCFKSEIGITDFQLTRLTQKNTVDYLKDVFEPNDFQIFQMINFNPSEHFIDTIRAKLLKSPYFRPFVNSVIETFRPLPEKSKKAKVLKALFL